MLKVLSNNCIVTDDGDQVYMCVLFMIFCQMSKSERSPEHPGKGRRVHSDSRRAQVTAGHTMSLEGGGHQEENEAGIPKPRGEVGFSLLEDRREGKRGYEQGLQRMAGEGCGRLSGVGAPHRWVGQRSQSPVLLHKQCVRARPPGLRAASSAGSCGAFSVRRQSSGPESHLWSGAEGGACLLGEPVRYMPSESPAWGWPLVTALGTHGLPSLLWALKSGCQPLLPLRFHEPDEAFPHLVKEHVLEVVCFFFHLLQTKNAYTYSS